MTIEEVSVLFDTGRKGDAKAAGRMFAHGKIETNDDADKDIAPEQIDDVEKQRQPQVAQKAAE